MTQISSVQQHFQIVLMEYTFFFHNLLAFFGRQNSQKKADVFKRRPLD